MLESWAVQMSSTACAQSKCSMLRIHVETSSSHWLFFSFHGQPLITRLQPHEGSVLNMYVCSNTGWLDHMLLVDSQGDYQAQQLYSCCLLAAFTCVCSGGSTHKGIDSWLLVKQIKATLNVFCVCRHVLLRTVTASATSGVPYNVSLCCVCHSRISASAK